MVYSKIRGELTTRAVQFSEKAVSWRGVFDEAIPPLPIPPLIGEGAREGCFAKPRHDHAISGELNSPELTTRMYSKKDFRMLA